MKTKLSLPVLALVALSLFTGCASQPSQYGKREVNVLGGLFKYEENGYARQGPLTVPVNSSEFFPRANLDGDSVSLLWGLITYVDQ